MIETQGKVRIGSAIADSFFVLCVQFVKVPAVRHMRK